MDESPRPSSLSHPRGGRAAALLEAMRVPHWTKNAFVAAPLLFAGRFDDPVSLARCAAAVAAFCLLSSAVYFINDVADRDRDRAHPDKVSRPVASGRLSVASALVAAGVLLVGGLAIAAWLELRAYDPSQPLAGLGLLVWTAAYLVLNLLYSWSLKHHVIVDVIAVAMGFVFRAMAGAAAILVPVSPWLVVCTFTLCLFLALTKRRGELAALDEPTAVNARAVNAAYRARDVEHMLSVSAALAILTYSLYCLAPRTVSRIGSAHMIWTIPIVVYGVFRYNRISRDVPRGDLVAVLLRDRVLWAVVAIYAALAGVIVKYGGHPAVAGILDVEAVSR